MNRRSLALVLAGGALAAAALISNPSRCAAAKKRVLIVNQTAGFHHSSVPTAAAFVRFLGLATGDWDVVGEATTPEEVAAAVTEEKLKDVDLVFFGNTTGKLNFTPEGHKAFYAWIEKGGAYAGVHSAADTFHDDPDYLNLVRGEFKTHEAQVKPMIYNQDPEHPATKDLPATWEVYDEIYQYKNWDRSKVHVLLSMHANPNHPEMTGDYPVAWTNRVGKGRMFYTSLGHREDVYLLPLYQKHIIGGMRWALGLANGDDAPGNPVK